jgi:hypothetical protein
MVIVMIVSVLPGGGHPVGASLVACDVAQPGASPQTPLGLDARQLANATAIVRTGQRLGVPARGHVVALVTALQESGLRMLANDGTDPRNHPVDARIVRTSLSFAHEGIGRDHNSINLFQQRPTIGAGPRGAPSSS